MSTLFGKSVASTYKDLLQVSNNNIGVDNVVRYIEDGEGTRSALALSTDTVVLSGHLLPQVNSQVDLGSAELKFRHLFLSDNTIYIGDQTFNTTDIQAVKDIRSSNVTVTELVSLTENAAQRGDIGLVDLALEFQTEYGSIKDTASSAVQPGTSPTFENVNLTGVITGPEIIKIDPAAINDNTGKVVIAGDLQVDGETTTVNSTTISTSSSVITLAQGATDTAQADGAGVVVDGANATIKYGATDNQWILDREINAPSIVSGKLSHSSQVDFDVSGFTLLSLTSDGSTNTATVDAKTTFNDTLNVGEAVQFGPGGSVGGIVPTVNGQSIVWDGAKWRPAVASTGDGEATEVPAAFTQSLPSGNSTYVIAFAQEYTAPPAITTDLQIEGDLPIIPYVITNVTTTNFTIEFAEALPALGYTLHVTFGGRDILWKNGDLNSIYYDQGDVVVNNMEISGNLSVAGTTTTINSTDLSIRDRNITLADNTLSRDLSGVNGNAGITWGNDNKVKFLYNSNEGFRFEEGGNGDIAKFRISADGGGGRYIGVGVGNEDLPELPVNQPYIRTNATDSAKNSLALVSKGGTSDNNGITFYTGLASGDVMERMRVDRVGKVGIGTSSPDTLLHIFANASSVNSTRLLTLENYSSDLAENSSYISFKFTDTNDNEDPQVMIGAVVGQNDSADSAVSEGAGAFVVRTNNPSGEGNPADGVQHDDSTNLRERFRVDYRGHVGIGTSDPARPLHVNSGEDNMTARFTSTDTAVTIELEDLTGRGWIEARNDFRFGNNEKELMRIESDGRFGVGTNLPITTAHIKGDALTIEEPEPTLGRKIQIIPPEAGVDARIRNHTTAAGFQFQNNPSADGETFVDLVKIDGAGRVGIGTTTIGDNYKLDVRGGVIVDDLRIRDTSFFVEGDTNIYYPVMIDLNDSQFDFTILRSTHTDTNSSGALNTRIWGHTSAWGNYNASVNYDHNSTLWNAPASLMSGFLVHPYRNKMILYLLGGRTYSLEQKQGSSRPSYSHQYHTTDAVDAMIKIFDENNYPLYIPGPFLHSNLESTITYFAENDPTPTNQSAFLATDIGRTDVTSKKYRSGSMLFGSEDTLDHRFIVNSGGGEATAEFKSTDGGARVFLERPTSAGDTWLGWRNTDKVGWLAGMENNDDSFHIYRYANIGDYVEGDPGNENGTALRIAPDGHTRVYNDFSWRDYTCSQTFGTASIAPRAGVNGVQLFLYARDTTGGSRGCGIDYGYGFAWRPSEDNVQDLGTIDYRWDDVRATNGTIQTSDANEKNTIVDSDLGLNFIQKLSPKSYKFNDKTRTHYGLIAQDVEQVLVDIEKNSTQFAGFCKDDIKDADGNVTSTSYGLRYNEFISPMIKAIQEQQAIIEAQNSKIEQLISRIETLENK